MRPLRLLQSGVWYEIRTRINNREPLFQRHKALALFTRVFHETTERFAFHIQGLTIADDRLTFYIKPADGMALPAIMKWLKQVFAQRYNRAEGREGHIWGDRYWSRILAGEPPATCRGVILGGRGISNGGAHSFVPTTRRGEPDIGVRPQSWLPHFSLPCDLSPG
jgi:REP element-mobilizing transposase RayT